MPKERRGITKIGFYCNMQRKHKLYVRSGAQMGEKMKKIWKKMAALMLVGVMSVCMAACGNSTNATGEKAESTGGTDNTDHADTADSKGKDCTIGVAFYQDSGLAVEASKAYLENLSDPLNVTFKYTVLTQTDEAANLTKIQELIASGVDGIICTMDLGMTSIIQECEAAGVYLGGYICDFDTSYTNAYDEVFKSEYFVGSSVDGQAPGNVTIGQQMFDSLIEYNERNADVPLTHVSLAIFPVWAFPTQMTAAEQFIAAVDEYNKTADTLITVDPLNEETDVLAFAPMDTTYFAKHEGTQAIMSFAAGSAFVYPIMVQAGVDKDIKLFTTGFDGGEEANFASAGTGTYQQNCVTPVETITYPLVLLLNKINEVSFADQPEEAERVSCDQFILNSDEDLAKFETNIYYTADAAHAIFTPEEVLNMTAYENPEATYAKLREKISTINIDSIK